VTRIAIGLAWVFIVAAGTAAAVHARRWEFDPAADIPHREHATTSAAIAEILAGEPPPRVYAVGEYHQTAGVKHVPSAATRFTHDIVDWLAPRARHLVVEAWLDDGCRSGAEVEHQVAAMIQRPPQARDDISGLVIAARAGQLTPTGLSVTCIEHAAMLDGRGRVDFLRLLELITEKLGDTTRALLAADPAHAVIVYGGALHNDLYPAWPLAELSYAQPIAAELGAGSVLELDLVVPELVAAMPSVRLEPWYPLLGRAAPDRTLVWRRGAGSYVVILPSQTVDAGAFAKPIATL
jgi:hypothetical protein